MERALPWLLRAVWVAVAATAGAAIDAATSDRTDPLAAVATYGGAAAWIVGVAAMAVPSVVGLTATRILVPLSIPAAIVAILTGGDASSIAWLVLAVLATVLALSGELGHAFVQASAYGDEERQLLRPPPAYALAAVVSWSAWAAATIAGPLLSASGDWLIGVPLTVGAVAMGAWSWPRWHRLSRRWLVIVPAGLVIHDPLVLAETLMLRRQEVAAARLAPADTGAADLTGPAGGHAVEIETTAPVTAILAGTPRAPSTVIHLEACLIAPTRPGRALAAVGGRRFRVG